MKRQLNTEYHFLEPFLNALPARFESEGKTIYKGRNELKVFEVDGFQLNVKSYRVPNLLKRIMYSFFRQSKAKRAYNNAQFLLSKGFETPQPVAYLECFSHGLLRESFFMSLQSSYGGLIKEFSDGSSIVGREDLIVSFGKLIAKVHNAGILHLDLSGGNVLIQKMEDGYHFSLIDLNRMKFQEIGMKKGCQNFNRLRGNNDFFRLLAETYAKERGFNVQACTNIVLKAKDKSIRYFARKKQLKKVFYSNYK